MLQQLTEFKITIYFLFPSLLQDVIKDPVNIQMQMQRARPEGKGGALAPSLGPLSTHPHVCPNPEAP